MWGISSVRAGGLKKRSEKISEDAENKQKNMLLRVAFFIFRNSPPRLAARQGVSGQVKANFCYEKRKDLTKHADAIAGRRNA